MSARAKLEESNFFLEKLRALQPLPQDLDKQRKSQYYLSAFLSSARSVLHYLLEEYNIKFGLNIALSEKMYPDTFKKAAEETNNNRALLFFKWWSKGKKALENAPVGKLLINKRDIGIHRVQVKPDLAKITVKDTVHLSGRLELKVFRKGKLVETRKSVEQPSPSPKETETTFDWFFSEYPDEPILSVCEKFLNMLTAIVTEAEQKFA